jgi:uncharacterized protein YggU (UPF0235/DUF167 family)
MTEKLIYVKVSAGTKIEKMQEVSPGHFKIKVQEPAEKGRANERVIELVAEYFNVSISSVTLKRGASSRDKTVSVIL